MTDRERYVLLRDDREDRTTVFADPAAHGHGARARPISSRRSGRWRRRMTQGKWIAGFMSYEAGHLFEEKLAPFAIDGRETPLMTFGIFDAPADDHPLADAAAARSRTSPFVTEPRADWDLRGLSPALRPAASAPARRATATRPT